MILSSLAVTITNMYQVHILIIRPLLSKTPSKRIPINTHQLSNHTITLKVPSLLLNMINIMTSRVPIKYSYDPTVI